MVQGFVGAGRVAGVICHQADRGRVLGFCLGTCNARLFHGLARLEQPPVVVQRERLPVADVLRLQLGKVIDVAGLDGCDGANAGNFAPGDLREVLHGHEHGVVGVFQRHFGGRQLRLRFGHVRARGIANAIGGLVALEFFRVGIVLGTGNLVLVLGVECLDVGLENPDHQVLGGFHQVVPAGFCLGLRLLQLVPATQVEERLLQRHGRTVAAVAPLEGQVLLGRRADRDRLGVLWRVPGFCRDAGQQAGPADADVFLNGGMIGPGLQVGGVVGGGLHVGLIRAKRQGISAKEARQQGGQKKWGLS